MLQRNLALLFVAGILWYPNHSAADDDKPADKQDSSVKVEKDRYELPDGDPEALLGFIKQLSAFRPTTSDEFLEHRKRGPEAIQNAATKILEIEKDKTSEAYRTAASFLLNVKVQGIPRAKPVEQAEVLVEVEQFLGTVPELTKNELSVAFTTANLLERSGNTSLAIEAYTKFGNLFSNAKEDLLVSYGQKMLGSARRIDLLGNEMKIEGQTMSGEEFNWESYRGKVVLIDFWATWCGPCIAELPNVKKHFEQYNKKGFEVVGISLDTDRERLEKFLKERELPWATLYQDDAGWEHPVASYYGVMAIPTVMLVDQEGKVVTLNARGPELGRQLAKLLGPPAENLGDGE